MRVGVFGTLFPVVVADLTRGGGHFGAAQGGVGTTHSAGGILSGLLGNAVVVWAGYDAAFLTQSAIAALGGALFWLAMPETAMPAIAAPKAAAPEAPAVA